MIFFVSLYLKLNKNIMAKNDPRPIETDRTKAIEWWNKLPMFNMDFPSKRMLSNIYYQREPSFLTGREIEEIWKKEILKEN